MTQNKGSENNRDTNKCLERKSRGNHCKLFSGWKPSTVGVNVRSDGVRVGRVRKVKVIGGRRTLRSVRLSRIGGRGGEGFATTTDQECRR